MTNNTIHNVPRELLEVIEQTWRIHYQGSPVTTDIAADAIEKGLGQLRALLSAPSPTGVDWLEVAAWQTNREGDSTFPRLHKTEGGAQKWVEFCNSGPRITKEPLSRTNQAAYIINSLRGEIERIGSAYKEMGPWRDSAAQRIGELEGLLREVRLPDDIGRMDIWTRIDAALSSGKEGE